MRRAIVPLALSILLPACGGRVLLGDLPSIDEDDASPDAVAPPNDGGVSDAVSPDAGLLACSLVGGTWDVTADTFYGTDASFQFASGGTFIGGPKSASLPAGEIYSGQWVLNDDAGTYGFGDGGLAAGTEVTFVNTTGMQCPSSDETNMALSYSADCATATFVVVSDACTGARLYFDGTTVLTKR